MTSDAVVAEHDSCYNIIVSGDLEILTEYNELDENKEWVCSVNIFDDEKMIYADLNGLFFADYELNNAVSAFLREEHGISATVIYYT